MQKTAVVTGAGGFIGHHLVTALREAGYYVYGIDLKHPEYEDTDANEFVIGDLRNKATWNFLYGKQIDEIYALAADMGGMGYIVGHDYETLTNNVLINVYTAMFAGASDSVQKVFYASSACVYPEELQDWEDVAPLKESDAIPANPQDGYGWEKLYSERVYLAAAERYGFQLVIGRFHNVYGPLGTYEGGREKAPAALCRKFATLDTANPLIEIWGDGEQTRSFCYIDDCVQAISGLMTHKDLPNEVTVNIGSNRLVSINDLVEMIGRIADVNYDVYHDMTKPQGVRGRNSDNTYIEQLLGWSPKTPLEDGLAETYYWIKSQCT